AVLTGSSVGMSAVRSFEHDLPSVFCQTGTLQQCSQGHARPFRIADRSELPLCSLHLRDEKDSAMPCGLQRRAPRSGSHVAQVLVPQSQRMADRTIDAQLIGGAFQLWRWKMAAYVEQLRRSEIGVDPIEGRLQILRLLLSDDQTCRKEWSSVVEVTLI